MPARQLRDPKLDRLARAVTAGGAVGLTRTEVSAVFGRNVRAAVLDELTAELVADGDYEVVLAETPGRHAQVRRRRQGPDDFFRLPSYGFFRSFVVRYTAARSRERKRGKVTCEPACGKVACMYVDPVIAGSARKYGVADEDMLHALRNPISVDYLDEGLTMLVGPRRDGNLLLEVGVVDGDSGPVIVHADRARTKYLPGWEGDH